MKSKTLQVISLIIAILGTLMAADATAKTLGIFDPRISYYWPLVLGLSSIVSRIAAIFADWLDDGKLNNSWKAGVAVLIFLFAMLQLTGCIFSEVNGQLGYTDQQGRTITAGGGVKLKNYAK